MKEFLHGELQNMSMKSLEYEIIDNRLYLKFVHQLKAMPMLYLYKNGKPLFDAQIKSIDASQYCIDFKEALDGDVCFELYVNTVNQECYRYGTRDADFIRELRWQQNQAPN